MKKAGIDIDNWNNIPIPVVNSSKAFKKSLDNTSWVMTDLVSEIKSRNELIVR